MLPSCLCVGEGDGVWGTGVFMGAHIIPLILGRKAQCVGADAGTSTQDWGPVEGQLKFFSN